MSEVHKESAAGDLSVWLSPGEAKRLFHLLYNVEEAGWEGCPYKDSDQPLWAQMVDAGVHHADTARSWDEVPSGSVTLVDRPSRTPRLVEQVLSVLPANATAQVAEGTHNLVLSITVPHAE